MPALPLEESDAIIRGVVLNARAALTEDQTALYSAFDTRVDELLKPCSAVSVGQTVTALRWGGALQLQSGLIKVRQADQTMPVVGGNYILFLKHHSEADPGFVIVTGYRVDGGVVSALDILPGPMRFDGSTEAVFLATLRNDLP